MTKIDPWRPFREVLDAPWEQARKWKTETGGKIVYHLPPDVPEEIIHAAGALPVAIAGAGITISRAQAHIPGYTCSHAMGALELGLRGDLALVDGMVIPYVCDTTRNLFHIWDHCFPGMSNEFLRIPKKIKYPPARDYLYAEFSRLLNSMCRLTGNDTDAERLNSSLALYNQSRARLRQAYEKHKTAPQVWTAERVQTLFESGLKMPRELHLEWMDALPWDEKSEPACESIPVYVRGKVWDPPGILALFDELGFSLVGDEIVTSIRSAACHASTNGDPIEALVDKHFASVPYPGYHIQADEVVRNFVNRVRESNAAGVIFLNPKFCEAAGFDTPDCQKAIAEQKIPNLILETSARGISVGQIRMRLEAFREMISNDLP